MKLTKIIISLISVCIFFSSCYVARMPEESSEEETLTSEISSEETSSDDYFIENNIKFSKPAVPKIDFEKDFYAQVKNNYITTASERSLNFAFVDEQGNCYIQKLDGGFSCYDANGKKTVIEGILEGCYKIKDTIYFWDSDSNDLYALRNDKINLIQKNIGYIILSKDKLYFSSPLHYIIDGVTYCENTLYSVSNGSITPKKLKEFVDFINPYLEYNDKIWWKSSTGLFLEYNSQYFYYNAVNEDHPMSNFNTILTVAGDYVYFWEKEHNFIIQYNLITNEKIYCKSPFITVSILSNDFNFTDSNFFFLDNDKVVRTDLDFENRTELDVNLGSQYRININKNRIFIRYLKPNAGASDRYSVAEIDKDGKVLKIFE